jgi:hypothetical protein
MNSPKHHFRAFSAGPFTNPDGGPIGQEKCLSALLTPANLHSGGDDSQSDPTGGGYYDLADDGAVVDAPRRWDQGLEECVPI